jgi:hypothetical protein
MALKRAILQVDASAETLHFMNEPLVAVTIGRDIPEGSRQRDIRRGDEHQSLLDRRDIPLE